MAAKDERPIWHTRLMKLVEESFEFIGVTAKALREGVVVRAIPKQDGKYRVVYRFGVRGEFLEADMTEDLRDILARARSVLDIAMYSMVTAQASPPLTDRQLRATYFPIAATEASWKSMAGQEHLKALTQDQRDALEAIQPFVTGNSVIAEFSRIHNTDKHQSPLKLAVIPDSEYVMFFEHIRPQRADGAEYWVDWVTPLPEVENGVDFVEFRSSDPITSAGIEDVPIAPAVNVDGEWRDIQHFLWDLMEFVTRATAILGDGDTGLADSLDSLFRFQREQLAAFKKMIVDRDPAAEADWYRMAGTPQGPHAPEEASDGLAWLGLGRTNPATSPPCQLP